jgi:probable F420-dependent oxidoreductase
VQFIYQYPERSGRDADMLAPGPVAEVARAAEAAGFMGFGFTEHPAPSARWLDSGGHQTLDPFVALSHVAAVTSRLRLLTYLSVVPYRNPLLLAKASATVDILSGGRFILGVGTGYLKSEFRALGVDFDQRNALFDEALEVLALHWSGEPFSYQGTHFECRDVIARPHPPNRTIPIWIGGNSALTRRRVAERAQGWMPLFGPAELFQTTRTPALDASGLGAAISEVRAAAGSRGPALDVVVPYMQPDMARSGHDFAADREAFAGFEAAGVTWVSVSGSTQSLAETQGFLERFGAACIGRQG